MVESDQTNGSGPPPVDERLLSILVCPICKRSVDEAGQELVCPECGRRYPIRDGIVVMLPEEASPPDRPEPGK